MVVMDLLCGVKEALGFMFPLTPALRVDIASSSR